MTLRVGMCKHRSTRKAKAIGGRCYYPDVPKFGGRRREFCPFKPTESLRKCTLIKPDGDNN